MQDNLDNLRHIEGFPIGEDADLHALSDPPHYTAYANPHIADFIARHGRPYDEATDAYHREPYVGDVSEGKNDPIYNAHSYHTKVPYKAIMPFIEHYTEPGDIVFDGFCGTGMTGVAAQMLGRKAVLCDLSPAATFIAYNYNTPVDVQAFEREAKRILQEVERACGWMYETWHPHCDDLNRVEGRINYTVWSDLFICPYCETEFVFWDVAVEDGSVSSTFSCSKCAAELTKRILKRATELVWDQALNCQIERARRKPVIINYSVKGGKKRFEKRPDVEDMALIEKIESRTIPHWYPTSRIDGDVDLWYERDYRSLGIFAIHHFYAKRNLWMTAYLWERVRQVEDTRLQHQLLFWLQSVTMGFSLLYRYLKNAYSQVNRILSGTLYIRSTISEVSPWYALAGKVKRIPKASSLAKTGFCAVTAQSSTDVTLPKNAIEYIFTDPPFGSNIIYSDLSIVWESWLKVATSTQNEAVVHRRKKDGHDINTYRQMMTAAFAQMYRALKPGRWITVEFHNTKASVWNAIQEALSKAGFVVAQVAVLDKQQGSFKQDTAAGAVKNDLVINAYKPRRAFEERFLQKAGVGQERDFIAQHLHMLPLAANVERSREMLFAKLLAYYVQRGYEIQYDADSFYALLRTEFIEADGYWFKDEDQLQAYRQNKQKQAETDTGGQQSLFVFDERSAIQWLKRFMLDNPASFSDIQPAYLKALQTSDDQIPELQTLLAENFGSPDSLGRYRWPQPDMQERLEKERQQRLLRLFHDYLRQAQSGQKLTDVRKEAVLTGFMHAYRAKRFHDIITLGQKLNKSLVENSAEIFDFIEIAETKANQP
jgi:DNA modification methylase